MLEWLRQLDERVLGRPGAGAADTRPVRAFLRLAILAATVLAAAQVARVVAGVTRSDPRAILLGLVGLLCWVAVGAAAGLRLRRGRAHP